MLPTDLLHLVVAFLPCRDTRAALGYTYDTCITLGIPPCPLSIQPALKTHLEKLLPLRQTGWGIHVFCPDRRISVWLCFEPNDDSEQLLITVTTCIGFDGPGRLRQQLCGQVRDLHVMSGDVDAPGRWSVHRSTRPASYDALYGADFGSAPWFRPDNCVNWFVRDEETEGVMSLKEYCRRINQV